MSHERVAVYEKKVLVNGVSNRMLEEGKEQKKVRPTIAKCPRLDRRRAPKRPSTKQPLNSPQRRKGTYSDKSSKPSVTKVLPFEGED